MGRGGGSWRERRAWGGGKSRRGKGGRKLRKRAEELRKREGENQSRRSDEQNMGDARRPPRQIFLRRAMPRCGASCRSPDGRAPGNSSDKNSKS